MVVERFQQVISQLFQQVRSLACLLFWTQDPIWLVIKELCWLALPFVDAKPVLDSSHILARQDIENEYSNMKLRLDQGLFGSRSGL